MTAGTPRQDTLDANTLAFYRRALDTLTAAAVPYLVGGGYALDHYTGLGRSTKDVDLYVYPHDRDRTLQAFSAAGYRVEGVFHWVGKVYSGEDCVDVICNTTNGIAAVDDVWFAHAAEAEVVGCAVRLAPAEELIWAKGFLMERERYDGSDVAHLLLAHGAELDWPRLLDRFGAQWRVLLSHLILFGFIYPEQRTQIPAPVMQDLLARLQRDMVGGSPTERLCQGTLLSWRQYLVDVEEWGYDDARVSEGYLTAEQVAQWTEAFREG